MFVIPMLQYWAVQMISPKLQCVSDNHLQREIPEIHKLLFSFILRSYVLLQQKVFFSTQGDKKCTRNTMNQASLNDLVS